MPYRPGLYGYLLGNGHLFYSGKVMADLERFEALRQLQGGRRARSRTGRAGSSREVRHPDHHHDARKFAQWQCIAALLAALDARARRPRSGRICPDTEAGGTIYADYLLEMTIAGEIVREWRSWEHMAPEDFPDHAAGPPRRMDPRQHRRRDRRRQYPSSASATFRP